MIRVPRRPTEADRLIPIQYDAKIDAVEKALSAAMQTEKVRDNRIRFGKACSLQVPLRERHPLKGFGRGDPG